MPRPDRPRVAILGAGPVGLEAALAAHKLGLPFALYERGRVGEYVRRWGHVRMFSPFGQNSTPLGRAVLQAEKADLPAPGDYLTGNEYADQYLEPLAQTAAVLDFLHLEAQVTHVGRVGCLKSDAAGDPHRARQPFRLLVRDAKGKERADEADVVLDCTGTYGQPGWFGAGGIPAVGELGIRDRIAYGTEDVLGQRRQHYAGKTTLIVGAGYSAATNVCDLATLAESVPETWVVWLARGSRHQPLTRIANDPLKERDRLTVRANQYAARGDGNLEFHHSSVVTAVAAAGDGFHVTALCAGEERTFTVERLIANVGFTPDRVLYRELHVAEDATTHAPRSGEPNYFVLGAKSHGRNSRFLLRTGFEQVREAFAAIVGKPDVDFGKL